MAQSICGQTTGSPQRKKKVLVELAVEMGMERAQIVGLHHTILCKRILHSQYAPWFFQRVWKRMVSWFNAVTPTLRTSRFVHTVKMSVGQLLRRDFIYAAIYDDNAAVPHAQQELWRNHGAQFDLQLLEECASNLYDSRVDFNGTVPGAADLYLGRLSVAQKRTAPAVRHRQRGLEQSASVLRQAQPKP